ncbi:MAG: type II secretion system F family protein [Candidatus Binatus sp.]
MPAIYASLTVFFLFGAISVAIYAAIYGINRPFDERITEIGVKMRVAYGNPANVDMDSDSYTRSLFRWVAKRLPEPAANTPEREKLAQTLVRAGFPGSRAVRIFHFTRLSSTAGTALLALVVAIAFGFHGVKPLMFMLMGLGVGAFAPGYYVGRKAKIRQQLIASQLSDVLDLLVVCVEAGLGLSEAIKVVGSETQRQNQAIGTELSIVSAELASGNSLGQALKSFADRTAVDDIKPLAATLVQSEKLGASIGPALRSISDSMRSTRRLRAEEAAAKTTVKILFPLVLFILPAMMSVIVGPAMIQIMRALTSVPKP